MSHYQRPILGPLRSLMLSPGIGILAFALFELYLAFWAPQTAITVNQVRWGAPDPVLGGRLMPDSHAIVESPEYQAQYHVSAQGFRGQRTYAPHPPAGTSRLLLVGDSFSFATGVDDDEAWPARLEQELRAAGHRVETINSGIPGLDTRTAYLYLQRLLAELHPTAVLIGFVPHDLMSNRPLDDAATAERGVEAAERARSTSQLHAVSFFKRKLLDIDRLYVGLYAFTARREYFQLPHSRRLDRQIGITRELFADIARLCAEHGARPIVLSLPQQFQLLYAAGDFELDSLDVHWIDREFAPHAADNGYLWVPLLPQLVAAYERDPRPLYYRQNGHLNAYGNRVLAEILARQEALRPPFAAAPTPAGAGTPPPPQADAGAASA